MLFVGHRLAKVISRLVGKAMLKAKIDATFTSFVQHLSEIAILVFVVLAALNLLGVKTESFVVVIGAAGLAIGFASGTVKEIQIFNTVLNSPDNVRIIIPNGQVTGSNIMNYTVNGTRRIDLVIGVSYEDDLKKTRQVIEKVITNDNRILKEPAYTIAVSELAESSVNFVVRPWVNAADYWAVRFDLMEKIKIALDKNGISIPFPQRDIHMKTQSA